MDKKVKKFLKRIEKETPVRFHVLTQCPTETFINKMGQLTNFDTVIIDNRMSCFIHSCGDSNCDCILGLQILYGVSSELSDAEKVMRHIKSVAPKTQIELIDELNIDSWE